MIFVPSPAAVTQRATVSPRRRRPGVDCYLSPREPADPSVLARGSCRRSRELRRLHHIILGLVAGFIASKIVNKSGQGFLLDVVLGVVGAIVGGYLFALVGAEGVTGFNLYSMVVAVIGAVIVLVGYHALTGSRAI